MDKAKTDTILVERLYELVDPDPWGAGFRMQMIDHVDDKRYEGYDQRASFTVWDDWMHAERILYLADAPELYDPIMIDNLCDRYHILPEPIIIDGNHRLFAHVWLGRKTIKAHYGGRLDVLDYLKGETDSLPA